jgi:hypothetical protein
MSDPERGLGQMATRVIEHSIAHILHDMSVILVASSGLISGMGWLISGGLCVMVWVLCSALGLGTP